MTKKYQFCPHCSQPLEDDGSCPGCSYGHKRQQQTKATSAPRLCAYNDHGEACHQPGFLSTTTLGEGPWYCRRHFAAVMKWPALQALVTDKEEPMSKVDERVNRLVPRLTADSEHDWSMRCRDWTLSKLRSRGIQREPGEDEGEQALAVDKPQPTA